MNSVPSRAILEHFFPGMGRSVRLHHHCLLSRDSPSRFVQHTTWSAQWWWRRWWRRHLGIDISCSLRDVNGWLRRGGTPDLISHSLQLPQPPPPSSSTDRLEMIDEVPIKWSRRMACDIRYRRRSSSRRRRRLRWRRTAWRKNNEAPCRSVAVQWHRVRHCLMA